MQRLVTPRYFGVMIRLQFAHTRFQNAMRPMLPLAFVAFALPWRVFAQTSAPRALALGDSIAPDSDAPRAPSWHSIRTTGGIVTFELLALNSPARAIPSVPLGAVAADINPLLNERGGRRYAHGLTLSAELWSAWSVGNHVEVRLQPRISAGRDYDTAYQEFSLQSASIGVHAMNVSVETGRQAVVWGSAIEGGLMFSKSGRPLDMIRLSTIHSWRLPSVMKYAGSLSGTALIADLGPQQNFPHAKLLAYRLASDVSPNVQIALSAMAHEGGRGAPAASLLDRIVDITPGLHHFIHDDVQKISNKMAGVQFRIRIPSLHSLSLYEEYVLDDTFKFQYRTLWQDGGHILGASLPSLLSNHALTATGEFHHTGIRFYQHTPFTSGLAFNRVLFGDPLGPQGDGAYARLLYANGGRQRWQLDAAIERRGNDIFTVDPNVFRFVLLQPNPAEWRHRMTARWSVTPREGLSLNIEAGAERVGDFRFASHAHRTNALAAAGWTWRAW